MIVRHLPSDSAVVRDRYPEHWDWSQRTEMLATAVDQLRLLVWAKTEDAETGKNQPEPWPRPDPLDGAGPDDDDDELSSEAFAAMYAQLEERNGPRDTAGVR